MSINTDRLIDIIEDHASYDVGLRILMSVAETKELPPYGTLPIFNDSITTDSFIAAVELIAGKKYE